MTQFQDDVQIDGNLRVGDDPGATNAVVEAHRAGTSTGKPKRGLQVDGEVVNEDNLVNALEWSVHELNLGGGGGKTLGEASALRTALNLDGNQNLNTGVGLDVQVGQKVGATGTLNEAIGLRISDVTDAANNYAIQTGQGVVQIGDTLALTKDPGAGKVLTSDAVGNAAWEYGTWHLLDEQDLNGMSSYAPLSGSIPQDFFALRWSLMGKLSSSAYDSRRIFVRANNDTTAANYRSSYWYSGSQAATHLQGTVASFGDFWLPVLPGSTGNVGANAFGIFDAVIAGYSQTNIPKILYAKGSYASDGSSIAVQSFEGSGLWRSTAAITKLEFIVDTSVNFAAGSVLRLYGLKQ